MRQTNLVLSVTIAALLGAALGNALAWCAKAQAAVISVAGVGEQSVVQGVSLHGKVAPTAATLDLRTVVSRALDDAVATWKRRLRLRAEEIGMVQLSFVGKLSPNNCYGLYAGEGPVYCSGNHTVFVGTRAASSLMARFGEHGEAGISFLIGHEVGHHIQNLHGRFRWLRRTVRSAPSNAVNLIRRFELEADCLAGVWVHDSRAWVGSRGFRSDLLSAVKAMGDESVLGDAARSSSTQRALHGTSEQRVRWFSRGLTSGSVKACNTFAGAKL